MDGTDTMHAFNFFIHELMHELITLGRMHLLKRRKAQRTASELATQKSQAGQAPWTNRKNKDKTSNSAAGAVPV